MTEWVCKGMKKCKGCKVEKPLGAFSKEKDLMMNQNETTKDDLGEEGKPMWVAVKERLPEENQRVLAYVYNPSRKDTPRWSTLAFHSKLGRWDIGHCIVTHWQALPVPPEDLGV